MYTFNLESEPIVFKFRQNSFQIIQQLKEVYDFFGKPYRRDKYILTRSGKKVFIRSDGYPNYYPGIKYWDGLRDKDKINSLYLRGKLETDDTYPIPYCNLELGEAKDLALKIQRTMNSILKFKESEKECTTSLKL